MANSHEKLIPGLSYVFDGATATYVQSRESSTFFPSSGKQYSVSGVRVLTFDLTKGAEGIVDPATVMLCFTLQNLSADAHLRLLSNSPLCLFHRLRVLAKGKLVEDIGYLHRLEEMFDILLPLNRRKSQSLMMMVTIGLVKSTIS